jgi:hypothetical protein
LSDSLSLKTLIAFAVLLMTVGLAHGQNPVPAPAAPEPQKPASTTRKVWTEDEIVSLRSPADNYIAEKEAREAAEALAKGRTVAAEVCPSSVKLKGPKTLEEAERAILDSLGDIDDQKATLAKLNKELDESPEDQKAAKSKEIERRTVVLEESQKELKALQDKRDNLASKAAPVSSATALTREAAAPLAMP